MLSLTSHQFGRFNDEARRRIDDGISARAEAHWPEHFQGDRLTTARAVVTQALEAARRHGMNTEYDLSRFVHLAFLLDQARYYEHAWALELLNQVPARGPRAVMNALVATARGRVASSV